MAKAGRGIIRSILITLKTPSTAQLYKHSKNFRTNDIPFNLLSFGQLFGIVKSEGLTLYNEIKLQSIYGSERAKARKERGTFCEAFGFAKIEAPYAVRKRIQKKRAQLKRPPR